MQIITVSGRIGKNAESREVRDNTVTSFNVAVDQGYGDRKVTNWYRVSVWGKKGSGAAPYLLKGGVVTVVGDLEFDTYEGKPQYNIRAHDFTLPTREARGNGGSTAPRNESSAAGGGFEDAFDDGEIPFIRSDGIF